jgi:TolB protein
MGARAYLTTICVLCAVNPALAQNEGDYTVITGTGQSLYRIAIPQLIDGGGAAAQARLGQQVLTNDLSLYGLFKVLDPRGFLANLGQEGLGIVRQAWLNVGAQAVVKAQFTRRGGRITAQFYLFDLGQQGETPVLSRTYTSSVMSVRRSVHQFGDAIVRYFTKEDGIFTTRVAFASIDQRRKTSQIYVIDFDGYGVYRVTRTGNQNLLPDWSPGGQLVYTSFLWSNPDLYLVSGGGGRAQRISKHPGLNTGGAFSPDGSQIALTLSKDGNAEIYLISPSGKVLRRVTNNAAIDTSPAWSPDGSQIAFVSNRAGSAQIYVVSAGGGSPRRITFQGSYNQEPAWCPRRDTPLIAYTARDNGRFDIFTIDINSGNLKRLTQGQGNNESPSWAPNGKLIVFSSSRGGLWLMNPDGLNQQQIYRGSASTPAWSRK